MLNYKIVTDSSSDIHFFNKTEFAVAPLKIVTDNKEYIDNQTLNVSEMTDDLLKYTGRSSTSCPSTGEWLAVFGDAERIFCVTMTAALSGCYNAACAAKQIYEELHPDRKVFVINSTSTGPGIKLIVEKISELISSGKDFEEICKDITEYQKKTGLLFMLESMKNLVNNGRVSSLVAKAAGLLGIRVIGKASKEGELKPLDKCRGVLKTLYSFEGIMKNEGFLGGKVRIAHCFNQNFAETLKQALISKFGNIDVEIYNCGGLCSFYAEKGGIIVGFEKGNLNPAL